MTVETLIPSLIEFDSVSTHEEGVGALFFLSETTRDMILALSETLYWKTRWYKLDDLQLTETEHDAVKIYASILEKEVLTMIDICSEFVDCLTNDINVQNAIDIRINSAVSEAEKRLLDKLKKLFLEVIHPPTENCNDHVFACIKQMLTYMDSKNLDWLESLEASVQNNILEFMSAVSTITGPDELSLDAVTGFVQWIVDNLLDAYPSISTTELIDEVACDIFCIVKDTCNVRIQDIHEYFLDRVKDAIPEFSFAGFIEFCNVMAEIVVGYPTRLVFDLIMLANTSATLTLDVLVGGTLKVVGGGTDLFVHMKAFSNDTDADWSILCVNCLPATVTIYVIAATLTDYTTNTTTVVGSTSYTDWKPVTLRTGRLYNITAFSQYTITTFSGGSGCVNYAQSARIKPNVPASVITYDAGSCASHAIGNQDGQWVQNSQINVFTNSCDFYAEPTI